MLKFVKIRNFPESCKILKIRMLHLWMRVTLFLLFLPLFLIVCIPQVRFQDDMIRWWWW